MERWRVEIFFDFGSGDLEGKSWCGAAHGDTPPTHPTPSLIRVGKIGSEQCRC